MSEDPSKAVRHAITRLLARREYGFWEVIDKLSAKGFEQTSVIETLTSFTEAGLQSDARFAESTLRNTASKGQGLRRARAHLSALKVGDDAIAQAIREVDIDWFLIALQAKRKKFGDEIAVEFAEKAKQQRFLAYRGFSQDEIDHAITYRD